MAFRRQSNAAGKRSVAGDVELAQGDDGTGGSWHAETRRRRDWRVQRLSRMVGESGHGDCEDMILGTFGDILTRLSFEK